MCRTKLTRLDTHSDVSPDITPRTIPQPFGASLKPPRRAGSGRIEDDPTYGPGATGNMAPGNGGGAMLPPLEHEMDMDMLGDEGDEGDKTIYCICERVSFGEMIGCDGSDCEREWVSWRARQISRAIVADASQYHCSSTSVVSACRPFPRASGSAPTAVAQTRRPRSGDDLVYVFDQVRVCYTSSSVDVDSVMGLLHLRPTLVQTDCRTCHVAFRSRRTHR